MGRLDVRIISARGLPDTQLVSKPDPYAKVTLENKTFETPFIENDVNPKWDHTVKFQVADEKSSVIKMELWNKNTVSDDFMGSYQCAISGLVKGKEDVQWYLLQQCKTNAEIQIGMLAIDFGRDEPPAPAENNGSQQPGYPPQQPGACIPGGAPGKGNAEQRAAKKAARQAAKEERKAAKKAGGKGKKKRNPEEKAARKGKKAAKKAKRQAKKQEKLRAKKARGMDSDTDTGTDTDDSDLDTDSDDSD